MPGQPQQGMSKGGGVNPMSTGGSPNLAALFGGTPATDPGQSLPQILPPQRPVIQPPAPRIQQPIPTQTPYTPMINGKLVTSPAAAHAFMMGPDAAKATPDIGRMMAQWSQRLRPNR